MAFLMSLTAIGDIKTIRRANDITSVRYADASFHVNCKPNESIFLRGFLMLLASL
jgi:hypothetical protein